MKIKLLIVLLFTSINIIYSQEVRTIQPSIMVIPRAAEGQDLRTIIDENPDIRVAISTVTEGFRERDYITKDFVALLKGLLKDEVVTSENQTEFRNRIFQNAGTDIVVEIDFSLVKSNTGNLARIILNGNETDSGNALSTKVCESGKRYTEDVGGLSKIAVQNCLDDFLDTMNKAFTQIVEDGKSVKIDISFSEDSRYTMNSTVSSKDDERLKYLIEDWLDENAYKNYVKITSTTDTKIAVEDFRYPLRDDRNRNNTPRNIQRNLDRFFGSINIPVQIDYSNNTLYVTIK